jgi:hypothetical protein
MKKLKDLKKEWEVWTVFENTGRPNTLIDSFASKEEANEYLNQISEFVQHANVGRTYIDSTGFTQWI